MVLALTGLVYLQYRWVTDSYRVKEEQFTHIVNDAMEHIAQKIEKMERLEAMRMGVDPDNMLPPVNLSPKGEPTAVASANSGSAAMMNQYALMIDEYEETNNMLLEQLRNNKTQVFLGVDINPNATHCDGIEVSRVIPNTSADHADLRPGDILESIDNVVLECTDDLLDVLARYSPNEIVNVGFRRAQLSYSPGLGSKIRTIQSQDTISLGGTKLVRSEVRVENMDSVIEDINILWEPKYTDHIVPLRLQDRRVLRQMIQQQISHNHQQVQRLAFEMAIRNKPLAERIDPRKLDETIEGALNNMGIETAYQFCLRSDRGDLIFAKPNQVSQELLNSDYSHQLYQNDMFAQKGELLLFFPNRQKYLLGRSQAMLGASFLFNLIILLIFASTIRTIIRQKKLSDMKTDFINNMTHELKTPISTIKLASEMLADPGLARSESMVSRYVSMIADENERLKQHVEKVLQFARMEKGDLKLNMEEVNMHDLIRDILQKVNLRIQNANGVLEEHLEAKNVVLKGDRLHLTNMILNLLDNAIKYAKETPDVTVRTRNTDEEFIVSIQDKGIGMSKETVKRIFDKFYRVPTGNVHNVKGFGLGLSYVRLMVEAHGGIVSATSKLDKGSVFEIRFPLNGKQLNT